MLQSPSSDEVDKIDKKYFSQNKNFSLVKPAVRLQTNPEADTLERAVISSSCTLKWNGRAFSSSMNCFKIIGGKLLVFLEMRRAFKDEMFVISFTALSFKFAQVWSAAW